MENHIIGAPTKEFRPTYRQTTDRELFSRSQGSIHTTTGMTNNKVIHKEEVMKKKEVTRNDALQCAKENEEIMVRAGLTNAFEVTNMGTGGTNIAMFGESEASTTIIMGAEAAMFWSMSARGKEFGIAAFDTVDYLSAGICMGLTTPVCNGNSILAILELPAADIQFNLRDSIEYAMAIRSMSENADFAAISLLTKRNEGGEGNGSIFENISGIDSIHLVEDYECGSRSNHGMHLVTANDGSDLVIRFEFLMCFADADGECGDGLVFRENIKEWLEEADGECNDRQMVEDSEIFIYSVDTKARHLVEDDSEICIYSTDTKTGQMLESGREIFIDFSQTNAAQLVEHDSAAHFEFCNALSGYFGDMSERMANDNFYVELAVKVYDEQSVEDDEMMYLAMTFYETYPVQKSEHERMATTHLDKVSSGHSDIHFTQYPAQMIYDSITMSQLQSPIEYLRRYFIIDRGKRCDIDCISVCGFAIFGLILHLVIFYDFTKFCGFAMGQIAAIAFAIYISANKRQSLQTEEFLSLRDHGNLFCCEMIVDEWNWTSNATAYPPSSPAMRLTDSPIFEPSDLSDLSSSHKHSAQSNGKLIDVLKMKIYILLLPMEGNMLLKKLFICAGSTQANKLKKISVRKYEDETSSILDDEREEVLIFDIGFYDKMVGKEAVVAARDIIFENEILDILACHDCTHDGNKLNVPIRGATVENSSGDEESFSSETMAAEELLQIGCDNLTMDFIIYPIFQPTADPTTDPTAYPTFEPTADPTTDPTAYPTFQLTADPTTDPTASPTFEPTVDPTTDPTSEQTMDAMDATFDFVMTHVSHTQTRDDDSTYFTFDDIENVIHFDVMIEDRSEKRTEDRNCNILYFIMSNKTKIQTKGDDALYFDALNTASSETQAEDKNDNIFHFMMTDNAMIQTPFDDVTYFDALNNILHFIMSDKSDHATTQTTFDNIICFDVTSTATLDTQAGCRDDNGSYSIMSDKEKTQTREQFIYSDTSTMRPTHAPTKRPTHAPTLQSMNDPISYPIMDSIAKTSDLIVVMVILYLAIWFLDKIFYGLRCFDLDLFAAADTTTKAERASVLVESFCLSFEHGVERDADLRKLNLMSDLKIFVNEINGSMSLDLSVAINPPYNEDICIADLSDFIYFNKASDILSQKMDENKCKDAHDKRSILPSNYGAISNEREREEMVLNIGLFLCGDETAISAMREVFWYLIIFMCIGAMITCTWYVRK